KAPEEVRIDAYGASHHLDVHAAPQDLLPQHAQLKVRQTLAHAPVDAGAVGQVRTRTGAIDEEAVGLRYNALVAVARHVPHDHLVALADRTPAELGISGRSAAHVNDWRLVADGLVHQAWQELRIGSQLRPLAPVLVP